MYDQLLLLYRQNLFPQHVTHGVTQAQPLVSTCYLSVWLSFNLYAQPVILHSAYVCEQCPLSNTIGRIKMQMFHSFLSVLIQIQMHLLSI